MQIAIHTSSKIIIPPFTKISTVKKILYSLPKLLSPDKSISTLNK